MQRKTSTFEDTDVVLACWNGKSQRSKTALDLAGKAGSVIKNIFPDERIRYVKEPGIPHIVKRGSRTQKHCTGTTGIIRGLLPISHVF